MGYESIIGKALFGKITPEQAALEVAHLYAVQRAITCRCGAILDVRKSVYIEGKDSGASAILCGHCYDKVKTALAVGSHFEIHDPRPVKKARKPKVEKGQGVLSL